jgi:LmbE family N-acetylglucosaminyl deacetylase
VLPLHLELPAQRPLSVLTIGAHPDDIEIGAGGTLLTLAESRPGLRARYVVLTGTEERQSEARNAAAAFLPGAELTVDLHHLPEGRLPAVWDRVKDILEAVAQTWAPDLILAPSCSDAHQDHRTIGEVLPTVFRNQLSLSYEIPKWDGDLGRPSIYFPLAPEVAQRKVELLHKCFPSQASRDWWDDEVFLGLARLRGMECRAPYSEAFTCTKAVVQPLASSQSRVVVERGADPGAITAEDLGA